METKAQKAAITKIEEILSSVQNPNRIYHLSEYVDKIYALIDEYDLAGRIDVLEKVYDSLIEISRFEYAAKFAKKYGL